MEKELAFIWWLGKLGDYLLDKYQFSITHIFMENPEMGLASYDFFHEGFNEGKDYKEFSKEVLQRYKEQES